MTLNFDQERIEGLTTVHMEATADDISRVVLDIQGMTINGVWFNGEVAQYKIDDTYRDSLGMGLNIYTTKTLSKGEEFTVQVSYQTTEDQKAANWLTPV